MCQSTNTASSPELEMGRSGNEATVVLKLKRLLSKNLMLFHLCTTICTHPHTQDSIQQVVTQLQGMGFDDEGGWLTELVKAKGGDIGRVLDALHPST